MTVCHVPGIMLGIKGLPKDRQQRVPVFGEFMDLLSCGE